MSEIRKNMDSKRDMQCWVSLFFLLFVWMPFIGKNLMSPLTKWSLPVSIAACVIYLPLHFAARKTEGIQLYLIILGMFVIGAVSVPFNWAAYTFFLYACFAGGEIFNLRERIIQFILVNLGSLPIYLYFNVWFGYPVMQMALSFIIGLGIYVDFVRQQGLMNMAEQEIARERLAKAADRERIARDLHDLLGHTLSMIALKAELASKLAASDAGRSARESAEVANIARDALSQVRQAIVGLKSVSLLDALRQAEATLSAAGIHNEIILRPIQQLDREREHALAQSLTEAITNVVRHASAKFVSVKLEQIGGDTVLTVKDNGMATTIKEGNGLTGMRERLHTVGGKLILNSDSGMTLQASVANASTVS